MYNKKGEEITLDEDYDLTKGAYVLVSAKDQYGNAVTSLDWSANKNAIVQIAGGLTNLTAANTTSEEITVAGVKYAGIKLDKSAALGAGNATIIVISNGTGVTAQGTVSVANGVAYSARTAHPFLRNGCAVLAEYAAGQVAHWSTDYSYIKIQFFIYHSDFFVLPPGICLLSYQHQSPLR